MASITGSEVGRRSCWRGWRRGKPAANRYFCDARDEQRRLDRAWSHDRSAKIRQVESSAKSGEGAWMSRRFLSGLSLSLLPSLSTQSGKAPQAVTRRNAKPPAGRRMEGAPLGTPSPNGHLEARLRLENNNKNTDTNTTFLPTTHPTPSH